MELPNPLKALQELLKESFNDAYDSGYDNGREDMVMAAEKIAENYPQMQAAALINLLRRAFERSKQEYEIRKQSQLN